MNRNFILPFLVVAVGLAACSPSIGQATPSALAATNTPPATIPPARVSASTPTPVPSASVTPIPPSLPVLASPVLARVAFQDENNGWGIAINNDGHVLRTIDGGRTWLDATPPGTGSIGFSTVLEVLNASNVWVLVPAADYFSGTLYHTGDGGATWTSNPVPFGGGFFQFLDDHTGRALADREARAGSEAVELFQTSDGGASWVSVFHNDASQAGSSDSLPLEGIKNGMTFLDASTGWVTGSTPKPGEVYLYVTRDGGASWSKQSPPLPTGYEAYLYTTQPPVFFGQDGFLPLLVTLTDRVDLTFYTTHDGGLTWGGDPDNPKMTIRPGLAAFADALHGWSWDGGPSLHLTSDGAQTWSSIHASPDLGGNLSQLQFVPTTNGAFTGWALTRVDESGKSRLYHTTNGSEWIPLNPSY